MQLDSGTDSVKRDRRKYKSSLRNEKKQSKRLFIASAKEVVNEQKRQIKKKKKRLKYMNMSLFIFRTHTKFFLNGYNMLVSLTFSRKFSLTEAKKKKARNNKNDK